MKQEHDWHIELVYMRDCIYWVLNNIDDLGRRKQVTGNLESVHARLNEFCEITKGEEQ